MAIKDIVTELWPLHRTLVCDGMDEALDIIGQHMPAESGYKVETYPAGEPAWTWRVPERYAVHEAYIEVEGGERVVDFADNPLHIVSYSLPVDKDLAWHELEPHLHYSERRPKAIPWEFKYYERSWGFCLSKEAFDRLPRDRRYRAVIRSEFLTGPDDGMRLSVAMLHPEGGPVPDAGEFIVCTHVCHPNQANDDISGVATAIELARRLAARPLTPGAMSVRFLFCPETIGSICYLSHHEELIPNLRGGIFLEMTGNRNSLVLQRTRQDNHLLDSVSRHILKSRVGDFREDAFRKVITNDEFVINGPGVNVPCVSISRWPYDEYHTSDDNPDIIFEDMLSEAADVAEEITRLYAADYVPRRTFRGPVFLSGYGLWVDWRENPGLNRALDELMLMLEGEHSVFEIAQVLGLPFEDIRRYIERLRTAGLVESLSSACGGDTSGREQVQQLSTWR